MASIFKENKIMNLFKILLAVLSINIFYAESISENQAF